MTITSERKNFAWTHDLIPFGTRDKWLTISSDEGHYELAFRIRRLAESPAGAANG